ncbi:hypothetical protein AB4Y88_10960 [Paenarthrobacter sp. RAF9]
MSTDVSRQGRILSAEIVRFTRRSARRYRRSRSSWGDRFVDAYSWGLGIGVYQRAPGGFPSPSTAAPWSCLHSSARLPLPPPVP